MSLRVSVVHFHQPVTGLQGTERSETDMWLVLMGDRKIIWPIFNIARWLIALG